MHSRKIGRDIVQIGAHALDAGKSIQEALISPLATGLAKAGTVQLFNHVTWLVKVA